MERDAARRLWEYPDGADGPFVILCRSTENIFYNTSRSKLPTEVMSFASTYSVIWALDKGKLSVPENSVDLPSKRFLPTLVA